MALEWSKQGRRFLQRIQRLAADLDLEWIAERGPTGIMQYQRDIAELQRNIQKAIGDVKTDRRPTKEKREEVSELAYLLLRARSIGDAFAWRLLAHEAKVIVPLSENHSVPVASREDDGSRGVFGVAESLMQSGWGVPIIHDITDCLRIGDITFVSPIAGDRPNFQRRTVEVKTHRVSSVLHDDGTETVNDQANIVGHDPMPEFVDEGATSASVNSTAPKRSWREDRRLQKQLRRMDVAVHKRRAEDNSISTLDGQAYITVTADVKGTDWKGVRRAIRRAHNDGYATFGDSGLVTWLIFYNSEGVDTEDIQKSDVLTAARRMFDLAPPGKRNSLTLIGVPPSTEDKSAPRSLPFWLWDVPQRVKREILRRELLIIAIVNSAGLEGALEERGFRIDHGSYRDPRSFELIRNIEWPDGTYGEMHHPAPWPQITDAVQDFTGLDVVLGKMDAMTNLSALPLDKLMEAKAAARRLGEDEEAAR